MQILSGKETVKKENANVKLKGTGWNHVLANSNFTQGRDVTKVTGIYMPFPAHSHNPSPPSRDHIIGPRKDIYGSTKLRINEKL
jgi:hypothetical protein